ncbi:MAG: hypothetical protein WDW38_001113 [Sanguina aurantia]
MMREKQVDAAGVDIDRFPELGSAHRRTLDMPPRTTAAPRAVPASDLRRGRLPQHEVGGVIFVRRNFDPGAGDQLLGVATGEGAIGGERIDVEPSMPGSWGHPRRDLDIQRPCSWSSSQPAAGPPAAAGAAAVPPAHAAADATAGSRPCLNSSSSSSSSGAATAPQPKAAPQTSRTRQ